MLGIDAPEKSQPCGRNATKALGELLYDVMKVTVTVLSSDSYARVAADPPYFDGQRIGVQLVRNGLAWHHTV
ncbi:MAG: thermonuclease family protein [Aureliella sp.]